MDFDKLLNSLDQLSIDKNKIPAKDFSKFVDLYQKETQLSDAEVKSLSEEFLSRIDPYENINIIDDSGRTVLTLPRINNSTRTIDKEFEGAKNTFRNQANAEVPRYRADAVKGIIEGVRGSTQNPEYLQAVEDRVNDFKQVNDVFESTKAKAIQSEKIEGEVEEALTPSVETEFDWEIK